MALEDSLGMVGIIVCITVTEWDAGTDAAGTVVCVVVGDTSFDMLASDVADKTMVGMVRFSVERGERVRG